MFSALRARLAKARTGPIPAARRLVWTWLAEEGPRFPLPRRLRWWRHGFRQDAVELYGFPRPDFRDYLSDFAELRMKRLNPDPAFFRHKAIRRALMLAAGFPQVDTVALLWRGRIVMHPFGGAATPVTAGELECRLRDDGGPFIVKPEDGAGGDKTYLVEPDGAGLVCRWGHESKPFRVDDFRNRFTMIERRAQPAEWWRVLYPGSVNTMRILTIWPEDAPAPFIARATQRMGTSATLPADNASLGGIFAPIDVDTGRMGEGRQLTHLRVRFARHPESGAQIAGAYLPGWDRIKAEVLRAAASLPVNCHVGWDIMVDNQQRPVVLEANATTGVDVLQTEGGMLADPRIRRYYEENNAV